MLVIELKNIPKLANELAIKNTVIAPVKRDDNETVFQKLETGEKINLDYSVTILPAKDLFLPAKEQTFVYDIKRKKILPNKESEKFILFGLNIRDLEALVQLDEIMKNPVADYFYFKKRDAATVVAVIDEGRSMPTIGVDLILKKTSAKEYKVVETTKRGKKITKSKLFKNKINGSQFSATRKSYESEAHKVMPKLRELLLDAELLHDAVRWSWKGMPETWEKLAKECLSCGICTYVCPLCYCFSVEDHCSLDGKSCNKERCWTACTLPEFAKITGGHNFHATIKERYYNWYYHKFVRGYTEYGKSQCVACARCQKYCPANIDIEEVLVKIVKNFEKRT